MTAEATPAGRPVDEPDRDVVETLRSSRRRRRLVGGAVLVALLVVALRGAGLGPGGESDGDEPRDDSRSTTTATSAPGESTTSASGVTVELGPSTTVAPPDVAEPRAPVDLAAPPPAGDAVEVARWWASVFVAYQGAEPMADVVARLAPYTTPALQAELQAVPPAASFGLPQEVVGASAQPDGQRLQVTVETPGALVFYHLVLAQDPAGTWQVSQATRV